MFLVWTASGAGICKFDDAGYLEGIIIYEDIPRPEIVAAEEFEGASVVPPRYEIRCDGTEQIASWILQSRICCTTNAIPFPFEMKNVLFRNIK